MKAEKGKFRAEAEKRVLEDKVQQVGKKLSAAQGKLREADNELRESDMCSDSLKRSLR